MMNFNIQLFADAQTNTTGTMSVEMKTYYSDYLIDLAEPCARPVCGLLPCAPERR